MAANIERSNTKVGNTLTLLFFSLGLQRKSLVVVFYPPLIELKQQIFFL
jgi:hypothetical protein